MTRREVCGEESREGRQQRSEDTGSYVLPPRHLISSDVALKLYEWLQNGVSIRANMDHLSKCEYGVRTWGRSQIGARR